MKNTPAAACAAIAILTLPTMASAYVGPGAGLSLLGAFWALIVALFMAAFFLLAWPVRRMLRRHANRGARSSRRAEASAPTHDGSDDRSAA